MEILLKRMLLTLLLGLPLLAPPAIAAVVDIVVADNEPAALNLARAAEHALQQLRPAPTTSVREISSVNKNPPADALVIAVGDALLDWVASPMNAYPATLSFYVSSGNYASHNNDASRRNYENRGNTHTALFRDQPLIRQLLLARALLPKARHALILHSQPLLPPLPDTSATQYAGFRLRVTPVTNDDDWAKPLSRWLSESDVLIGVEDRNLYNRTTIRSVLLTTYRHGKVLIGPNRGFVSAGSLASAYTSPEQYLQQLQTMVRNWQNTGTLPPAQFPVHYQIAVNRQVASSLGLHLADDDTLLATMLDLQQQAGEMPR